MSFHDRTANAARGKWRGILMQLGVPSSFLRNKHGPCPICGGEDRFRFDDREGRGSSICNACGSRDGFQLAQAFLGEDFRTVSSRIDVIVGNLTPDTAAPKRDLTEADRVKMLRAIYKESRVIEPGDVAHRYLSSRHIEELIYPAALRFCPSLKDGEGGVRPAIVAMIGVPGQGKFVSMHRTFLRPDGSGKADMDSPRKLMPGEIPDGACVMLSEWTGSGAIGIAEGIETAMSASAMFQIPVWAAISAGMLAKWSPPSGAEEVVIFGDNDPKFAGQAAAYALARRIATKPDAPTVTVKIPTTIGTDWADEYMRGKA